MGVMVAQVVNTPDKEREFSTWAICTAAEEYYIIYPN